MYSSSKGEVYVKLLVEITDGTQENPYVVEDINQLIEISSSPTKHYVLGNDISLASISNWTPIGTQDNPFTGSLNGYNTNIDDGTYFKITVGRIFQSALVFLKRAQIVRCSLIYEIVEPVCEKKICSASPGYGRNHIRVVIRKVIIRYFDIKPLVDVSEIFFSKSFSVIFRMTCCIEVSAIHIRYKMNACKFRI